MNRSIYIRIARLIAIMVLCTAIVILAVVWDNLSKTVHKNITAGLNATERLYKRELNDFQTSKVEKIELMLENDEYMQALNSASKSIQQKALQDISLELEANFVAINDSTDATNTVLSANERKLPNDVLEEMIKASEQRSSGAFFYTMEDKMYLLLTAPGGSLNEEKCLLVAYRFDNALIEQLSKSFGMRIAIVFGQEESRVVSTLESDTSPEQLYAWQLSDNYLGLFNPKVIIGLQELYTKRIPIENIKNDKASTYLAINAQRVASNFTSLLSTIALVSLLAVMIAISLSVYSVKRIISPLKKLVSSAKSIAQGDYSGELKLSKAPSEINALTDAFEAMRDAVKEREKTITRQVQIDPLTELFNRGYLKVIISERLQNQSNFQAVGINIRGFRSINDVFGYEVGDACLKLIAQRVSSLEGIAARVTGGEIIWLPKDEHTHDSLISLQKDLESDISIKGISINLKIVIGVMSLPSDAKSAEDLYRRMNIVIDEAHATKTFLLRYRDSQELRYLRRLSIVSELKNTLDQNDGQLSLAYQPKVELKQNLTKQIDNAVYIEALARWNNPALGKVAPDEFVSVAEHAGFIRVLTRWVIKTVIADLIAFKEAGLEVNIAVNISADDVLDVSLLPYLQELLKDAGLSPNNVLLELTERVIVKNPERSIKRLHELKDAGFKIAIDDFGTGYSSLSYLTQLPIDILKIDKSFVFELAQREQLQAICKTILTLAQNLQMNVVAEGIEDEASMQILTEFGCEWGQGYLICKPIPRNDLIAWIQTNQNSA